MPDPFVYKSFIAHGSGSAISEKIAERLTSVGYIQTGKSGSILNFRYPSIRFSSKKPLTCVSRLSLSTTDNNGSVHIIIGVTFTKIRYFIIIVMLMVCGVIPALIGIARNGVPEIPLSSYVGIPLGFMVHYHVRWRVFRTLKRLVRSVEETYHEIHR